MSRRHHGGRPHRYNGPSRPLDSSRPAAQAGRPDGPPAIDPSADTRSDARSTVAPAASAPTVVASPAAATPAMVAAAPVVAAPERADGEPLSRQPETDTSPAHDVGVGDGPAMAGQQAPAAGPRPQNGQGYGVGAACTAPQLRRFIKSRPYVPMHELRRRFGIDGGEDDVTPVQLSSGRIYVGLPSREGSLLGELLRGGEVGYELSLDPRSPIVVGLYPMRPVARN